jgi:xylan 1,4-beta-xylosidase
VNRSSWLLATLLFVTGGPGSVVAQLERVSIRVASNTKLGPPTPMWAWFGYDEPNYTYMRDGKKLLSALQAASPVPVFVRTHNLLTTHQCAGRA